MPYIQLGPKRIHYTDLKPENGDPRATFVCVHGLGSSQDYYHAVAQTLQANNFRCITFDTHGSARSSYTFIEQNIPSLAADVIGLMDALDVSKAVVLGHSMGGIVVAHLAAESNDRLVAAVLIGPVYPSESLTAVGETRIEAVEKYGMEAMANTIPSSAPAKKASPLVRAFMRELLLGQNPAGYISNCRVIINAKPPAYSKIAVPVLIIAGDEDKAAPLEGCQKMFDEMNTEKRLQVMKGVGHWHCLEEPDEVSKLILAFYQDSLAGN